MSSRKNGTLYIGATNYLIKRVYEHREKLIDGFTKKYNIHQLVYYEEYQNIYTAIEREKQLKQWDRRRKLKLIEKNNDNWEDLYEKLF